MLSNLKYLIYLIAILFSATFLYSKPKAVATDSIKLEQVDEILKAPEVENSSDTNIKEGPKPNYMAPITQKLMTQNTSFLPLIIMLVFISSIITIVIVASKMKKKKINKTRFLK